MRRVYGMKVARLTLGDLSVCLVLLLPQGGGMSGEESAEAIRAGLTSWRRAEPVDETETAFLCARSRCLV